MIRKFEKKDLENVAQLWLETNISAHPFIDEYYWRNNFKDVKSMFSDAELYVSDHDGEINCFIGMNGSYIAVIFVSQQSQGKGIGKQLLDYVKNIKETLQLSVYENNERAVSFYIREGFKIQSSLIDADTLEKEYAMMWNK